MVTTHPISDVKGVGKALYKRFLDAGIKTTYDLITTPPKAYEDYTTVDVSALSDGQIVTLQAVVLSAVHVHSMTRVSRATFDILVDGLTLSVIAFNQNYLKESLHAGDEIIVKGSYQARTSSITASKIHHMANVRLIQPIYGLEGIYDRHISKIIKAIETDQQVDIFETLPMEDLETYRMPRRDQAFHMLHFPESKKDIQEAQRRFKYEEAFFLSLQMSYQTKEKTKRPPKVYDLERVKKAIERLPFELTDDQKKATNDIFKDFRKPYAQFRLIQGDVGSGKTVVAGLAALAVASANEQVAIMAPTELLARQHYDVLSRLFEEMSIALLSSRTKDKKTLKDRISHHEIDVVIGTHAMIEEDVVFDRLGLVIIDEQHRFGVRARSELGNKAMSQDILYLSATPIPRTLAMVAFKDANISVIRTKPEARPDVMTHYVNRDDIQMVFSDMDRRLANGENIFIVVPAIESLEKGENIETVSGLIADRFNVDVWTMHAKMASDDRDLAMASFREKRGAILIATTMIEVGIDVRHATMMVVFSAEQFGLSQLHQLRGRVGRGDRPSVCYLISEKEDVNRLMILQSTNDGFELSAKDLALRGPGQFVGSRQSGFFKFRFLDFFEDSAILEEASRRVERLLDDPMFEGSVRQAHLVKRLKRMQGASEPYAM